MLMIWYYWNSWRDFSDGVLKEGIWNERPWKNKILVGLQIEHLKNGILEHQTTYTENILKRFSMDKAYPLGILMVVRSLNVEKDPFRPRENNEEIIGPEVSYLSAIWALLMYLASHKRPDISFVVNLLARFSSYPTRRYWNGINHFVTSKVQNIWACSLII